MRYFQSEPKGHRSTMYHAVLVAYLEWTRRLGFKWVHIWVEPPKMGDEYIFFARADQQRKPMKRDTLRDWYKRMLDKAKEKGIVKEYGAMHEKFGQIKSLREIPLFHGDQWEITVPSLLGLDENHFDPCTHLLVGPNDGQLGYWRHVTTWEWKIPAQQMPAAAAPAVAEQQIDVKIGK